jgi:hypothetical protein
MRDDITFQGALEAESPSPSRVLRALKWGGADASFVAVGRDRPRLVFETCGAELLVRPGVDASAFREPNDPANDGAFSARHRRCRSRVSCSMCERGDSNSHVLADTRT